VKKLIFLNNSLDDFNLFHISHVHLELYVVGDFFQFCKANFSGRFL